MSKIVKTGTALKTLDGRPLKIAKAGHVATAQERVDERLHDNNTQELTLGILIINSLLDPRNVTDKTTGQEKVEWFNLSQMIYGKDTVNLSDKEIVMIKDMICKTEDTLRAGQACNLLDAATRDNKEE